MTRPLRLAILGATGSVGQSTLDVVERHPGRFEVIVLTAHRRAEELAALCRRCDPKLAVVGTDAAAQELRAAIAGAGLRTEVAVGPAALEEAVVRDDVDAVMAAIVGAAGLASCLAAAQAGKRLLLANKEALVVGGALFMQAVRRGGATLLPIDSEHSAIFQCLPLDRAQWPAWIDHIVLTASGGPFRTRDPATLHGVTPEEAVAHPNWVMGRKISVDSATMMNKGLEVIEARWLFELPPERIRVIVHPQSVIHSMVACADGSVLAQLGTPDMRVPIAYGLSFPERIESGATRLNFEQMAGLHFEPMDYSRYPALRLAYDALAAREGSTVLLNAANEEAVAAFLDRRLGYTDIHRVVAGTVEALQPALGPIGRLDELLALDEQARSHARQTMKALP